MIERLYTAEFLPAYWALVIMLVGLFVAIPAARIRADLPTPAGLHTLPPDATLWRGASTALLNQYLTIRIVLATIGL